MVASMRSRVFAAGCALALGACVRPQPCGWDEQLAEGATYDVSLVERYAPGETTTFYTPDLDLTRPAETCAMLDEIAVGLDAQVQLVEGPDAALRCSVWVGEIIDPEGELEMMRRAPEAVALPPEPLEELI